MNEINQTAEERTAAVKALLKAAECDANDAKLKHIETLERRANMTPTEQLEDMAKEEKSPYYEDNFKQRFDCLRDIKQHNGFIYLVADEYKSHQKAIKKAIAIFGEHADPATIQEYAEQHTLHDTVMSVRNFEKHLQLVLMMAAQAPQYFDSELKEVINRGRAAIMEAHEWFRKNNNKGITSDMYKALTGDDTVCTDKKRFAMLLGENWQAVVSNVDDMRAAMDLIL